MFSPEERRTLVRIALVSFAEIPNLIWLWAMLFFPTDWENQHGYQQLAASLIASILHWVVCVPISFAFASRHISALLPILLFTTPMAHFIGSMLPPPFCLLFYIIPSAAMLVTGADETVGLTPKFLWRTNLTSPNSNCDVQTSTEWYIYRAIALLFMSLFILLLAK
jgi:hypothetical protein